MKKIIIFGTGVHSKVVFSEIIQLRKFSILGFIDDFIEKGEIIETHKRKKYKNLGKIKDLKKFKNVSGIIGIGTNYVRKKIFEEINTLIKNFKWATVISKNSIINGKVTIGDGSVIVSNSVINTGTIIGNHCLINTSSSIDHDNKFDDFSSTGPSVTTGGNVSVGEMSYLGIGSTIKHQINIGKNTIIGGNSFVNKNCEDNSVYYGVPSKKIRTRKSEDSYS